MKDLDLSFVSMSDNLSAKSHHQAALEKSSSIVSVFDWRAIWQHTNVSSDLGTQISVQPLSAVHPWMPQNAAPLDGVTCIPICSGPLPIEALLVLDLGGLTS